jgi:predicted  nucleic acid-binding Zn-ribbon protein
VRPTDQRGTILIAVAAILVAVAATCAPAAPAPPGIPGVPELGPPSTAPIGSPAAPTTPPSATTPAVAPPTAVPAAPAAAAPSAPTTPATSAAAASAGPLITAEEHYAKGEVPFNGGWVLLDNLFKDYLAARAEMQPIDAKSKAAREVIAAIQAQLNTMKNESFQADLPIRKDISKQMAKRRDLAKDAETPAPLKPRLQQLPQQPRNYAANMHSQYSNSSSNQYDMMMQDWQRQADLINRSNTAATQKYQQEQAAWKKAKDTADKELPNVDQAVKDLQGKIDQNSAALATRQAPLLEKIKVANDDAQAIARKGTVIETRLKAIVDALKASPESLRFKHRIVEWEGIFSSLADLEKQLAETQAEIDRVTQQMKAEAKAAGRPLADNWRHPQQDSMDALKALLARARTAAR